MNIWICPFSFHWTLDDFFSVKSFEWNFSFHIANFVRGERENGLTIIIPKSKSRVALQWTRFVKVLQAFFDFENEFISELFLLILMSVVSWFFDADYFTFIYTIYWKRKQEVSECDFSLIAKIKKQREVASRNEVEGRKKMWSIWDALLCKSRSRVIRCICLILRFGAISWFLFGWLDFETC